MICNPQIETMNGEAMKSLQTEKLKKVIKWIYEKSFFYQCKMDELRLKPEDISNLSDLAKLPFTTRADLADNYPYGLLTFPVSSVVRVHTIGNLQPVAVAYTSGDISKWLEMLARTLVAGGLNPTSVLLIAANYGLSSEGLGLHYAAELIGATVVPASVIEPSEQLKAIETFGATAIAGDAGYLLELANKAAELGIKPQNLPISTIYAIITNLERNNVSEKLTESFNAKVIEIYSVNELIGPGIAGRCSAEHSLHIHEDYFYPEIIDPLTGEIKPEGETGELVLTTLGKEAMPIIRYRTGHFTAIDRTLCPCGRTLAKLIY
ncbi:phenylacetate--CoA ligase family protein [Dendrosporobacter sp. 1207_IL3150]|uniref:phenylacetate--CoA ligase family protein n=1 Tax=Dendrosporobacter sp. 1207_IL3150 TaxID=3084054 RepID=UPI002FDB0B9B